MNLFCSTRRLTDAREDHLTEFLAAALEQCPSFRSAFAKRFLADFAKKHSWCPPEIEKVETQVQFPDSTCCPDMLLTLGDSHKIVCEHKLEAPETAGPEQDPRNQLERYLDLPIDGLVYIRLSGKAPKSEVLEHRKYVRPDNDYGYFLWRDIYPLLVEWQHEHILLHWLKDGFERLGFTPPHPGVGEMNGPDEAENRRNKKNFVKLWGPVRAAAGKMGWNEIEPGSIVEFYLKNNPASIAEWVFISPIKPERFLVQITPRSDNEEQIREIRNRLEKVIESIDVQAEVAASTVSRQKGKERVVAVTSTQREVLADTREVSDMEMRLHDFIVPLLRALQNEDEPASR